MLLDMTEMNMSSESFCTNFTCSLCDYDTSKLRKIQKHFRKQHSITDLLQCPFCKFIVTEEALFSQHKKSVHPKDRFSCEVCKFSTKKWTKWKRHVQNGHSQNAGENGASQPKKNILTQQNFINGVKDSEDIYTVSKQVKPKPSENEVFKNDVTDMEQEEIHMKNECPFCNETFKSHSEFQAHIFNHTFDSPYSCQHCSYCCNDEDFLTKHINFVHKAHNNLTSTCGTRAERCRDVEMIECGSSETPTEASIKVDSSQSTNTKYVEYKKTLKVTNTDTVITKYTASGTVVLHSDEESQCNMVDETGAKDSGKSSFLSIKEPQTLKMSLGMKQESTPKFSSKFVISNNQKGENLGELLSRNSKRLTDSNGTADVHMLANDSQKENCFQSQGGTDDVQFTCENCSRTFANEENLARHISTHENKSSFVCEVCYKTYKTKWTLKRHMVMHANEGSYNCEFCNELFLYKSELEKHKAVHADQQTFGCPTCDRSFKLKRHLTLHIMKSHNTDNLFICDFCDTVFPCQSILTKHMITHADEPCHICEHCGKSFKSKYCLKRHKNIHTREKVYTCQYCSKSFTNRTSLNIHVRRHTGEKPYKCSYCSFASSDRTDLANHERIHRNEKRYKCDVCEYRAVMSGQLKKHYRVHTGEKPYQCDVCFKCFSQTSSRKTHMKTMHHIL